MAVEWKKIFIRGKIQTAASASSITPDCDDYEIVEHSNTEVAGTLTVNAPTGTPVNFQQLKMKIKSTNAQTFSWNAIYEDTTDVAKPTTIEAGKEIELLFEYHTSATKWRCIALTNIV